MNTKTEKTVGLILNTPEGKSVFYKAYFNNDELLKAVEHDKELNDLITELEVQELEIRYLKEEESKSNE